MFKEFVNKNVKVSLAQVRRDIQSQSEYIENSMQQFVRSCACSGVSHPLVDRATRIARAKATLEVLIELEKRLIDEFPECVPPKPDDTFGG